MPPLDRVGTVFRAGPCVAAGAVPLHLVALRGKPGVMSPGYLPFAGALRLLSIALIVAGIVGLKLLSPG